MKGSRKMFKQKLKKPIKATGKQHNGRRLSLGKKRWQIKGQGGGGGNQTLDIQGALHFRVCVLIEGSPARCESKKQVERYEKERTRTPTMQAEREITGL